MFPLRDNVRRSQCLQTFKARNRKRTRSSNKLSHATRKFQDTCQQYRLQKRERRNTFESESDVPLIEEIDGVQFYRTSLSVCESVTSNFIQRSKLQLSLKEDCSTMSRQQSKFLPIRLLESVKYVNPQLFSEEDDEQRKRKTLERIENNKENVLSTIESEFTELISGSKNSKTREEGEIQERAAFYAMNVKPDFKYISLPEDNFSHKEDPAYAASMCGQQLEYPLPKKRKNRNSLTDCCYLSFHRPDDPYDNSRSLPCGTKLYRPPAKLVELVADAVMGSPDGLLQVPQIYTAVMNKYPYFRYMDKTAVTSWRSSVRHALFQKWFKKLKFLTPEISSKGCFWCINSQIDKAEIIGIRKREEDVDSFDLDPSTHDTVIALLKEEDQQENSCQGSIQIDKVPVYHFKPGGDNPVLTACTATSNFNNHIVTNQRNAILPVSVLNSRCLSPYSDSSDSSSCLISPLMHSVRPDILGIDQCNSSGISWTPKLPFDQFLDSQSQIFTQNSSSQESDVLPCSNYDIFDSDSIVPSISPDLSSGRNSPALYDWTQDGLFMVTDTSSCNYSIMKNKSDNSEDIIDIIPINIQWSLGEISEVPSAIFDKDDISSLPEQLD